MTVKNEPRRDQPPPDPRPDETLTLAPGVWETEASGSSAVPPRAGSDLGDARQAPEHARGCDETKEDGKDEGGVPQAPGRSQAPEEPRIERFRER